MDTIEALLGIAMIRYYCPDSRNLPVFLKRGHHLGMGASIRHSSRVHHTRRRCIVRIIRSVGVVFHVFLQLDPLLLTLHLAKLFKVCLIQHMLLCHIAKRMGARLLPPFIHEYVTADHVVKC